MEATDLNQQNLRRLARELRDECRIKLELLKSANPDSSVPEQASAQGTEENLRVLEQTRASAEDLLIALQAATPDEFARHHERWAREWTNLKQSADSSEPLH